MAWDEKCDVLVVGSGAGGMVGAYVAAREGLSVILVESSDRFGGTSAYSGGGAWLPCNPVLKRAGSDETLEEAAVYYHAVVGDRTPRALQDAYLEAGAPLIEYLEQDPDFEFMVYPWPDYYGLAPNASAEGRHIMPMPLAASELGELRATLRPNLAEERAGEALADELLGGQALIGRFLLALSKRPNADLRRETALVELVREGDRVTGAVVRGVGGDRRIAVERGVIIAAGGFEHNAEMRTRYGVPGTTSGAMGPKSNTGVPIQAGIAIGADVDLMDQAWWSPGLMRPDGSATFTLGFDGGMFINQHGQRFMNESVAYDRAGREIIGLLEAGKLTLPFWLVYDDRDGGAPPIQFPNQPIGNLDDYRAAGLLRSGATLAELAARIDVPADALEASAQRLNGFVERGEDEDFHRGVEAYDRMFSEGKPPMDTVSRPPFHAMAFGLSDLGTKGGLRTDENARVLDSNGQVIQGLYAAGNSMAAVSGEAYPGGGNPVGSSMVFAYLAARDMA
ncbi:3-ketosteroid-delta-1-dehydrogenase [Croceicoccus estronivorus]|uniref:FAD-binding protein n=1 Tax=Croceicoccus estronivorus TaxID=1172626 RepID=UPI00082DAA3C|nr:FAD-binding protein [Croceicoccus estronivorus]OCC22948.1 3-ketosteroid-delta-1-dehydrogenase [Croceicoccus estronivorus]